MLFTLPADICLQVLSYLRTADLLRLRLTSRGAHHFFLLNEHSIFHQAAVRHAFVRPHTALRDAAAPRPVTDWKDLVRAHVALEHNWDGRGHAREGGYAAIGREGSVLSFSVDDSEGQRVAIALTSRGGLTVRTLEDNRLLWALSKEYVAATKIECSSGFLVFMAKHSGLEIWRRAADVGAPLLARGRPVCTPVPFGSPAAPRDFQESASALAPADPLAAASGRGQHVPHVFIDTAHAGPVRLFRATFPLLAYIGAHAPDKATVVDMGSGDAVCVVAVAPAPAPGRALGMPPRFRVPAKQRVPIDLALSRAHLCVCATDVVTVSRLPAHALDADAIVEDGPEPERQLVFGDAAAPRMPACVMAARGDVDSAQGSAPRPCPDSTAPRWTLLGGADVFEQYAIRPSSGPAGTSTALVPVGVPQQQQSEPGFITARFSPDGRHLVAATKLGLLAFAWDFARAEDGALFENITEVLDTREPLRDVRWDVNDRRLALRTQWEDVFVLTLDASRHALSPEPDPADGAVGRPSILRDAFAQRLRDYTNHELAGWTGGHGMPFTGMQMTPTAFWLVWDVSLLKQAVGRRERAARGEVTSREVGGASGIGSLCFVDFTPGV
ncbi:uncharacterized protein BXZ73DRAFT_105716 [Epithele typhae]|uniref:uncharacterized protein n=1 Tax=Epithele typhae TaxID=378194 RepID=UPI0020084C49|nr:uncharacterized protein BXZ73DRAFT_105716 [Epithele typhae]KAH9916738.1 hypothetical protein BXZ73DRAFT_105716 [Epithele typhae]